ncbi:hypothetical protein R3P38DRAFT_2860589 [Favolaschia claudopus]|uniref:Uncharacterized protein n=1 Tax=Favolaschia claudopus TaxID=2862362 RepID=A0AAW0DL60_9AGAR
MKFIQHLALAGSLVSYVLAQSIRIGSPANGTVVQPGSTLTVQIQQPSSLSNEIEVAVVIGFLNCPSPDPCPAPLDRIGTVLYNGPYHPVASPPGLPYQNISVTIPDSASSGDAQLNVVHFDLIGALPLPRTEARAATLVVN